MKRLPSLRRDIPARPSRPCRRALLGFTLVELLVTVAIAAVFLAVAAPSVTKMVRSNRIQSQASALMSDLQYARTEAVKRGQGVSVCASANGTTCSGANAWQAGWIVFYDKASPPACAVPAGVVAMRVRPAYSGNETIVAAPASTCINFNRGGFTSNLGNALVTLRFHTVDNDAPATRCIAVNIGGVLSSQKAGEGSCA